jgi:hypothetical protein
MFDLSNIIQLVLEIVVSVVLPILIKKLILWPLRPL